jgi:hypothetical protein
MKYHISTCMVFQRVALVQQSALWVVWQNESQSRAPWGCFLHALLHPTIAILKVVNPGSKSSKCSRCSRDAADAVDAAKASNNLLLCLFFASCLFCFGTHQLLLAFVSGLHNKTVYGFQDPKKGETDSFPDFKITKLRAPKAYQHWFEETREVGRENRILDTKSRSLRPCASISGENGTLIYVARFPSHFRFSH